MKSITLSGKRYRLADYRGRVEVSGKGVRTYLPAGISLDSPDIRELATAALMIQQRVRDGAAGLGEPTTCVPCPGCHARMCRAGEVCGVCSNG